MNTFLWTGFAVFWTATGIFGIAWMARRRGNLLSALRVGVPAFTAATMSLVVTVSPPGSLLPRILHHAGFTILAVFLLTTEFLRVLIRRQLGPTGDLNLQSSACRRFHAVTILFAPPAAIIILLSGWRLMYDFKWSLQVSWLWWVYVLFAIMMWHGTFFWTDEADRLIKRVESGNGARLPRGADLLMTVHGVVFLVIFAIAFDREATALPHPGKEIIAVLEESMSFLPPSGRSVAAAVCVWMVIGAVTGTAFKFGNRRKPSA